MNFFILSIETSETQVLYTIPRNLFKIEKFVFQRKIKAGILRAESRTQKTKNTDCEISVKLSKIISLKKENYYQLI